MASVRYIVTDIDPAVEFYRDNLDFRVDKHNPGKFAALIREDLTLYLSARAPAAGVKRAAIRKSGGWNRFMVVTPHLDELINRLRKAGAAFRGKSATVVLAEQFCLWTHQATSSSCSSSRRTRIGGRIVGSQLRSFVYEKCRAQPLNQTFGESNSPASFKYFRTVSTSNPTPSLSRSPAISDGIFRAAFSWIEFVATTAMPMTNLSRPSRSLAPKIFSAVPLDF
jgi:catechol 2,3-dioxygenase-like lactoylglutathione lyase family enzyme